MISRTSDTITNLAAAIVKAAAELEDIKKEGSAQIPTKSGGSFSYRYATLPGILQAVRPILTRHGLTVLQNASEGPHGSVHISTMLVHSSGEFIVLDALPMPMGNTAQETGSAITYGRRYQLLAALGLAADDDDDGATAAPRATTHRPTQSTSNAGGEVRVQRPGALATDKQKNAIRAISKKLGKLPPANLEELTFSQASDLIGQLDAEKANAERDGEEPF